MNSIINAHPNIAGILGLLLSAVVIGICHHFTSRRDARERAQYEAKKNAPQDPLEELMRQERIKQAVPLVTLIAMNLPVDVVSVTLITHYADGCNLALDCGKPERIEAPKEF